MKTSNICTACGTHYPATNTPEACPICLDDRQYIPTAGQTWISNQNLHEKHSVHIKKIKDSLYQLEIAPSFAIGQRALLVLSEKGNILWDCIPLLDEGAVAFIKSKGGLKAIAFSHPHYYSNMNEWAEVFDCPVYIHEKDAAWIFQGGPHIRLWHGDSHPLWDGMVLHNIGGHFPGSSIVHVPFLSDKGAVLCGDTMYVSPSKKHFSIMYSYPNRIPLPLQEIKAVGDRLSSISFDALYGFYSYQNITENVEALLKTSLLSYA